jgi:hypothetical protein
MGDIYQLTRSVEVAVEDVSPWPWLDQRSIPAMKQRIIEICQEANLTLLEVELPKFGGAVVYGDLEYAVEFGRRGNDDMTVTLVDDYELG